MAIIFNCSCGKRLRVGDEHADKQGKCPACGKIMTVPAVDAAPAPSRSATPVSPPAKPRLYTCSECGGMFTAGELVKKSGQIICRQCLAGPDLDDEVDDDPTPPRNKNKMLISTIGGAVMVGVIAFLLVRGLSANRPNTSPPPQPIAVAEADEPDMEEIDDFVEEEEIEDEEADDDSSGQQRNLLGLFKASMDQWDLLFWDYQQSDKDHQLGKNILADLRLTGRDQPRQVQYPFVVAGWGGLFSHADENDRKASMRLYQGGEGVPTDILVETFGQPRMQFEIEETEYYVFGMVSLLYDRDGHYLGMIDFQPIESPPDLAVGSEDEQSGDDNLADMVAMNQHDSPEAPPESASDKGESEQQDENNEDEEDTGSEKDLTDTEAKEDKDEPAQVGWKTFKLTKRRTGDSSDPIIAAAGQWARLSKGVPGELKTPPRRLRGKYSYYTSTLGGQKRVMLLNLDRQTQLYVDSDGDGDLSDEKPVKSRVTRSRSRRNKARIRFGPIDLKVNGRDGGSIIVENYSSNYMRVYPANWYEGKVRFGGESHYISLVDADLNGRYDDFAGLESAKSRRSVRIGDYLGVDRNQNRRLEPARFEVQPLTGKVGLPKGFFQIKPSSDGKKISVASVTPEFGTLDLGTMGVELLVLSEYGAYYLNGAEPKYKLPAGNYTCWNMAMVQLERGRTAYRLDAIDLKDLKAFSIRPDRSTTYKVGQPLILKTTVKTLNIKNNASEKIVSIGIEVYDQGGIEFNVGIERGGKRLPAPQFKIVDRGGKVLKTGKFEYG